MTYGTDMVAKRPYTIDAAALGDKISGSKRHLAYWGILSIDAYFLISYLLVHPYMDAASIVSGHLHRYRSLGRFSLRHFPQLMDLHGSSLVSSQLIIA